MNDQDRNNLLRYIEHTNAHCPHCGYVLAGLSTELCPECGKPFTLDELIKGRYAPKLFIFTAIGFFVSSFVLGVTIVLTPLAFIYFAIAVWWGGSIQTYAEMGPMLRRSLAVLAWFPVLLLGTYLLTMLIDVFL